MKKQIFYFASLLFLIGCDAKGPGGVEVDSGNPLFDVFGVICIIVFAYLGKKVVDLIYNNLSKKNTPASFENLEKLIKLKEDGHVTEEEFAKHRKRIMK